MYVLGVDGGSTKTIALVANDQGHILGAARGVGSNWVGDDVEIPMAWVIETARQAMQQAGLTGEAIAAGVFSLAGADWPEDHTRREAVLAQAHIARKIIVKNDTFGGLRAGISRPYGMVIAAGTGVNAAVITPDEHEYAFGYYVISGGAETIASEAFDAVLRGEDGRGLSTRLTPMVLSRLDFPDVESMLRAYILQKIESGRFNSICPLVFEAAVQGDDVAEAILVRHGHSLAEYATAMVHRFDMQALEFEVVLSGSVFKGVSPLLVDTIGEDIHRTAPRAKIVRPRFEPAVGSLLLAYDVFHIPQTEAINTNLAATSPATPFFDTSCG
jgi:N-acetylglucosamine kinase-like BadF-type ATPase